MRRRAERIDRATQAMAEVEGAVLGDERLSARLEDITWALAKRPGESLPKAMGSESALEATYRFLGNERVSATAILAPHLERTRDRCTHEGRVLVAFDIPSSASLVSAKDSATWHRRGAGCWGMLAWR